MKRNFIIANDCPNKEIILNNVEKINDFISKFKKYYSKYDKRLLTTKKKVVVNLKRGIVNVSIDFNKKHYGQCFRFYEDIVINY